MSVSVPNSLQMFYWHLEGHTVLRNKCKFTKKQQNVTTVLFGVKQSYQRIRKIKAEESSAEERVLLLSPAFPFPFLQLPFPPIFPSLKGGWSAPVTLKFFIPCCIYMEKIIKSADRDRVQTKFFCIDIIMEVISNVMDVPWEQVHPGCLKRRHCMSIYEKKSVCS